VYLLQQLASSVTLPKRIRLTQTAESLVLGRIKPERSSKRLYGYRRTMTLSVCGGVVGACS